MTSKGHPPRAQRRRSSARVRRRRRAAVSLAAVALVAVTVAAVVLVTPSPRPDAKPVAEASALPTATPTPEVPKTPAQKLLASSTEPNTCAVSFDGDQIAAEPMLQTEGALYAGLPIPARDGAVFAGWYATSADAEARAVPARVNGSKLVSCTNREITLHGSWTTPEANVAEKARIPIMMYHQFTTKPEGESGWLRGNYAYVGDVDAHLNHIATGGFYLPTWDELSAFIDGKLFLPNHSVLITDDDADQTWFDLAAPIVDKYKLLATSFMITAYRQDPPPNPYVLRRSHTHDMHQAGANGKGRMVNWTADEIAADLKTSAGVLGAAEVVAYPFGHYNDTTRKGVAQAGFTMGRTIEPGYVSIGTDKLALPVVRVNYGMSVADVARLIG